MNIEDLTPALELTGADVRSISGGMSQPTELPGVDGGPADEPSPTAKDWYPALPALPALPELPTSPVIDLFGGKTPGRWW